MMISECQLAEAVYKKYIVPTERKATGVVGIELEYPIVNLTGATEKEITQPVDFQVVQQLAEDFTARFGFAGEKRDDAGHIYFSEHPVNRDSISFDCSFNTLELSFGVEEDIHTIYQRFLAYYAFIQTELRAANHTLTGMGINPGYKVNKVEPIHNGRYRMLLRHLSSYEKYGNAIPFHHYPHFGLFSCASQVQLDVEKEELVEALNTFTKLEPMKAVLFANSVLDADPYHRFLAARDYLWKYSMHGMNPHNVDDYDTELHSLDEVVKYIETMSLYCLERDGKYINFAPLELKDYFSRDSVEGEYFSEETGRVEKIRFAPEIGDLEYLRSFKFNDLTFRGTIEFRSICEQPVKDVMASAAFHAGIKKELHNLTLLLDGEKRIYQQGYSIGELRRIFTGRDGERIVEKEYLSDFLKELLDLSAAGLRKRGFGEEEYLEPLYARAAAGTNPAIKGLQEKERGDSISQIIREYAAV